MCLSLSLKGCRGTAGTEDTKKLWLRDWKHQEPMQTWKQLCDEKQGLLFQTLSHRQGSAFFHLSRWFYKVLSFSDWTWVRKFEVWGLSDTFYCALKQISEKSIVFLLEVSVSFLTQLIMCDYKHISIKYHKKKFSWKTIRTEICNTKITRVDFQQEFYLIFPSECSL